MSAWKKVISSHKGSIIQQTIQSGRPNVLVLHHFFPKRISICHEISCSWHKNMLSHASKAKYLLCGLWNKKLGMPFNCLSFNLFPNKLGFFGKEYQYFWPHRYMKTTIKNILSIFIFGIYLTIFNNWTDPFRHIIADGLCIIMILAGVNSLNIISSQAEKDKPYCFLKE